jgi:hypothetical protein
MADKPTNYGLAEGTPAYQDYLDAQQNIKDIIAQREEGRLFDPTMLAMAQGFLSPTKTGSFGESLANVAGAVAPVQAAEDKRAMDMAKMRLELAQQGLQTSMDVDRVNNIKSMFPNMFPQKAQPAGAPAGAPPMGAPAPTPVGASTLPAGAPVPAPMGAPMGAPAGGAPQAVAPRPAPVAPVTPVKAPTEAPEGGLPLGVAGTQASLMNLSQDEQKLVALAMYEKKPLFDTLEKVNKMRQDSMVYKENYGIHVPSNTIYPFPTSKMEDVTFPGMKGVYKANAGDVMRLNHYAQTEDPRYNIVRDRIINGPKVGRAQEPAPAVGSPPAAPARQPTVGEVEAESARQKEMKTGEAKTEVDRRKALPEDISRASNMSQAANSLYEIVDKNPKGFGTFDKPGIIPAIGTLVRDGLRANATNINIGGLEDAARKANPKIKESDINAVRLAAADQATIELYYAKLFLSGDGPITEGERLIASRAGVGSVSNNPEVLKLRAQFVAKRADFDKERLENYRKFISGNKDATYLDFIGTPEYKKSAETYDKWVRGMAGKTSTKPQAGNPNAGKPNVGTARETVDSLLKD